MLRRDAVFRAMNRADDSLFRHWLDQPHIGGWWSDGATELRLIEQEMEQDGPTDTRIVELDGHPFAAVQDYVVRACDMPHYADLPAGARGLDTFLGDPAFLGQGHGAADLRQRAARPCAAGAPAVVVDPDPSNARAIAAYPIAALARAGFRPLGLRPCEDGDPVLVMEFRLH